MGRVAAIGLGEMNWTFQGTHCYLEIKQIAMNKQIVFIRAVKGVIIGQLLISVVGFGALFEIYSANFLMKHFWAVLLVLFSLAFLIAEFLAYLERRVAYYAARRLV
jgi:NitT/TauT family transport system permease protein